MPRPSRSRRTPRGGARSRRASRRRVLWCARSLAARAPPSRSGRPRPPRALCCSFFLSCARRPQAAARGCPPCSPQATRNMPRPLSGRALLSPPCRRRSVSLGAFQARKGSCIRGGAYKTRRPCSCIAKSPRPSCPRCCCRPGRGASSAPGQSLCRADTSRRRIPSDPRRPRRQGRLGDPSCQNGKRAAPRKPPAPWRGSCSPPPPERRAL